MTVPQSLKQLILDSDLFVSHIHLGPDADSLGSVLALRLALQALGKTVTVYCEDELPSFASFLPDFDLVEQLELSEAIKLPHDVYLSVDTAALRLATWHKGLIEFPKPLINIDHHPGNNLDTPYTWLDSSASSAAEMVYYLITDLGITITPDIGTCLLFAILGETGFFSFTNTNSSSLKIVSRLRDLGADYPSCIIAINRSYSFDHLKLWSFLLGKLKLSADGEFVYVTIDNQEWSAKFTDNTTANFANLFLPAVAGTKFGAILTESKPGITYGSIRSRLPGVDVSLIANILGGGGHEASAGFKIELPAKDAESEFLKVVGQLMNSHDI